MSVEIEYKAWKLKPLTVGQIVGLADEAFADRRRSVMEGAGAAGLADDAKRRIIADLERERGLAADVIRWAHTARGTMRVIEESLKLNGSGLKLDDLGLSLTDDWRLALRLLGFEPKEDEEADANPDPTASPPPSGI